MNSKQDIGEMLDIKEHNTAIQLFDKDGNVKLLWNENSLGKYFRKHGYEIRVPILTGLYGDFMLTHNLITSVGHAAANGRMSNQGSYSPFVNLAIGTGTTAAAAGDTALQTEITTAGGARGAATATQVTTSVTNDTTQLVKSWTFTGTFAVTEEGILDNGASAGSLLSHQVFSVVNVVPTDNLQITHKYQT
jgi:hypothetical protein